jgi:hypothetical protein
VVSRCKGWPFCDPRRMPIAVTPGSPRMFPILIEQAEPAGANLTCGRFDNLEEFLQIDIATGNNRDDWAGTGPPC